MLTVSQAQITPDIVVSRNSGVAPLAVYFDATATTANGVDYPVHELQYEWDFDDPDSGVWPISGVSRNYATSPAAAHVFEEPGTYVVTLYVTDENENNTSDTVTITVQNPDTVYSGTNTICFSTSGNFSGAPSGSQQVTTSSMSTVMSYAGANKRLLLRRGETFTGGTSMSLTGPLHLGAFGGGSALPRIQHGGTFFNSLGSDIRVTDLELEGDETTSSRIATTSSSGNHILLMNTRAVPGTIHVGYSASTSSPYPSGIFLVGNDWQDFGFGNGGNIVYVTAARIAILGNYFDDSTGGEHIIRIAHGERAVVSHNYIGTQASTKGLLTIRSNNGELTHDVFVTDNTFINNSDIGVGFIGQNSSTQYPSGENLIAERNFFANTTGNPSPVRVGLSIEHNEYKNNDYVTIRNNITLDARITVDGGVNHVWAYNNSGYSPGTGQVYFISFSSGSGQDRFARNNLFYRPNASSGSAVSGSSFTGSNNLTVTSNPYITSSIDGPEDYHLHSSSAGVDAGTAVPNPFDYDLNPRPSGTTWDVGAYEYQSYVAVTGVSVSPASIELEENDTEQLTANVSPSNATDQSLEWTSSNESVATVSSTGLVTAISEGTATITATTNEGEFTDTCEVTVTTASSYPYSIVAVTSSESGSNPEGTLDGEFGVGAGWETDVLGAWIQFEISEVKTVTSVDIVFKPQNNRSYYLVIETSLNGSSWTEVFDGQSSAVTQLDWEAIDVDDTSARYVRITGYGNTEGNWSVYREVRLNYGSAVTSSVTHVASDTSSGEAWRSTGVSKSYDIDEDDAYGTDGYRMFSVLKSSMPSYITNLSLGANTQTITYGTVEFDDPDLAISSTVANYNPGKLDLDIADDEEDVLLTMELAETIDFRLGIISGHINNEVLASVRVTIEGESTGQVSLSTNRQYTLFDISGQEGDIVTVYGTTRIGQYRNGIAGIFFDTPEE